MGWGFLLVVVAVTLLLGALSYLCFKASPGYPSKEIGWDVAGLFFGFLGAYGALISVIAGVIVLGLSLPYDLNLYAWGGGVLLSLGVLFGMAAMVQRDIMACYPNDCRISALLYYPCVILSAACLLDGLVFCAIAATF